MSGIDAGPAWNAWARVTPVLAAPAGTARYVRVTLPVSIAPDAQGTYPDLRVVDRGGNEVPYALDPARVAAGAAVLPLIDTGFVPHRGTQAVADAGASGALVDGLSLDIDAHARPTYFVRVAVDASDDRRTWRIVRDDAIVYRVEADGGRGNATVTFPPTRSRWIRLRVLDPSAPFPLRGARIAAAGVGGPPLTPLPLRMSETVNASAREQTWVFVAAVAMRPTAVSFVSDAGAYYERPVTVEAGDDGTSWTPIGDGTIARYVEGGARTAIPLTETTARYVRVRVRNGNDAPIPRLRPVLLARPHVAVFARGGTERRLLSGNPAAESPTYDLGARLAHESWQASDARTGATVPNEGYRDPRPVGERFPWLITAALVAVALGLGALALRTVKRATAR